MDVYSDDINEQSVQNMLVDKEAKKIAGETTHDIVKTITETVKTNVDQGKKGKRKKVEMIASKTEKYLLKKEFQINNPLIVLSDTKCVTKENEVVVEDDLKENNEENKLHKMHSKIEDKDNVAIVPTEIRISHASGMQIDTQAHDKETLAEEMNTDLQLCAWESWLGTVYVPRSAIFSARAGSFGDIPDKNQWMCWKNPRGYPGSFLSVFKCMTREQVFVWRLGHKYPPNEIVQWYWYHGTDYNAALDIIRNGIRLERGAACQDFSHGKGFYLSETFEGAKVWACNPMREKPAVVVFRVNFNFQLFNTICLDKESDWQAVVRYNRSGHKCCLTNSHDPSNDLKLRHHFEMCDYVYGPINGGKFSGPHPNNKDWNNWLPSGFTNACRQLCIKTKRLADAFGSPENIESILFF